MDRGFTHGKGNSLTPWVRELLVDKTDFKPARECLRNHISFCSLGRDNDHIL